MGLDKIVIEIDTNSKDLKTTAEQLASLGVIDKKNAEQFKKSNAEHQKALKETEAEAGKLEGQFKDLGNKIVAAFAVEQIIAFGAESVKAFASAEKSALKLNAALSAQGGTQKQLKELIEQSEKLGRSSIFDDDTIKDVQALSLQYGIQADTLKNKVIPAVIDYASATGKDLNSALTDVLQGMNGNAKALKLYGIEVKSTGDKGYDLDNILGQLNDKFKGQSEIIAGSTSGTIARLGNLWEDVKEAIGGTIANMFTFPQAVQEVNAQIDDVQKAANDRLRKKLSELTEAYNEAVEKGSATAYSLSLQISQIQSELTEREVKEQKKRSKVILDLKEEFHRMTIDQLQLEVDGENRIRSKYALDELAARQKIEDARIASEKKYMEEFKKRMDDFRKWVENDNFEAWMDERKQKEKEYDDAGKMLNKHLEENQDAQKEYNREHKDDLDKRIEDAKNGNREAYEYLKNLSTLGITDSKKAADAIKDIQKEVIAGMLKTTQMFFDSLVQASEMNVKSIDSQLDAQKSALETQKILAEQGLANTLAFEDRRQQELEKKKQAELKKQKRMKELEVFLNSIAKFAEDNPNTALAKALGLLAETKAAEAVFAEDGALLGSNGQASWSGRRHASGQDILVHAEKGEGILSRKEIGAMGGAGGFFALKSYLKNPIQERAIPTSKMFDNSGVISEIRELKETIKNKPDYKVEWDGLEYRLETMVRNGITERMKIQRRGL